MKLIVGPPNSGKSERVISRVAAAVRENQSGAWLIVPSAKAADVTVGKLQAALGARRAKPVSQVVATFPALYDAVLGKHGESYRWIGAIERERMLRRVITGLGEAGKLDYFAETASRPGLVTAMAAFIDELWRSGTDPERFASLVEGGSAKDRDVALIFERYRDALVAANATDAERAGLAALRLLEAESYNRALAPPQSPPPSSLLSRPISLVAADGFDFYTPVQVRLLSLLSAAGVETIVTLSYEARRAVHFWQERTRSRLAVASAEVIDCASSPSNQIERAAARLLEDDAASEPEQEREPSAIQIFSAPDRAAEVRAVAREVKRLVLNEGFAPDEIAVVSRSLSLYGHHLERIFADCSIPLALDCSLPLGDNPTVIALLRLLNLAARSFSRRATIDCLRMPFFDLSYFGLDEAAIDKLDRLSVKQNVARNRAQWSSALKAAASETKERRRSEIDAEDEEATLDERREIYSSLSDKLDRFFDALTPEPKATRRDYAARVERLIALLRVRELSCGEYDGAAIEAFQSLLAAIEGDQADAIAGADRDLLAGGEIPWSLFYAELERAVAATSIERPTARRSVIAQEVPGMRPHRYRALFVLGLIEGEFPARVSESAPYTAVEREALRRAGIDFAETSSDAGADVAQFYKAMTRAAERLYLTYARTDLAGGELLKSYLIDEVAAVADVKEARTARSVSQPEELSSAEIASLEELAAVTARTLRGLSADEKTAAGARTTLLDRKTAAAVEILRANLRSWPASQRGAAMELGRIAGARESSFSGMILDSGLLSELERAFGRGHYWHVGQINDYGTCPFRFFAGRVLRLVRVAEPAEGIRSDRRGTAYHKILEEVYRGLNQSGASLADGGDQAQIEMLVDSSAESVLESLAEEGALRRDALWEFEKREIKKRVLSLVLKEVEWASKTPSKPVAFERVFGMQGEPPLIIESDEGDINVCGIIDRIDEREDGCVVVDYKSSRAPIKHADALDGRNLQLPIYMLAASRVLVSGKRLAGGYYLHILSRKKGSEFPHRTNDALSPEAVMAQAEERVRDYVRRARAGKFPIRPNNDRCPASCEFDLMCRIQSVGASRSAEHEPYQV
jgi:ATP-dependent helicase/nuclease subunit B